MAEQQQGPHYNDSAADVIAVLLIGTIVIGTAVYWLATM